MKYYKTILNLFLLICLLNIHVYAKLKAETLNENDFYVPQIFYQSIKTLEISNTPKTLQKGLMHRKNLCTGCGMLFIFPEEKRVDMWMHNTPVSLDMIFMNKEGIILKIYENTKAFQDTPTYSSQNTKYVLELKAGFVKNIQLKTSMKINIEKLMTITKNSLFHANRSSLK